MIIKKYYGNSVEEAREEARGHLGSDCVILETVNAGDDSPARVTAMAHRRPSDEGAAADASGGDAPGEDNAPSTASPGGKGGPSGTYGRGDLIPRSLRNAVEDGWNALSGTGGSNGSSRSTENPNGARPEAGASGSPSGAALADPGTYDRRAGRGPGRQDASEEVTMSRRSTPIHRNGKESFDGHFNERAISQEVRALHRRFDQLESLMSDALISANLEYVSHPAFQQLLNTGMRPPTVSRWFETVLNRGVDPYEQPQDFLYELASIVRGTLDVEPSGPPPPNLLFVGPSGSGKTSLIMKLASHPDFMGGRSVALVTVRPSADRRHYSPLPLFAEEHGIPHFEANEGVEIGKLVPELADFDHVLYDTPPLSLKENDSFRDFWKIRQLLTPVTPLEVHFTVNATLQTRYFREDYAKDHPVQPDCIALTHLDETDRWGHLLPFLQKRSCSVRYVSRGPGSREGIRHFSPSWFAEHILSHS
ncbi:MAG: hypothetical protein U5K31_09190 [Balneolaceae bacterium]|nr:hypothetical protein [Balneolaceae bacterium]